MQLRKLKLEEIDESIRMSEFAFQLSLSANQFQNKIPPFLISFKMDFHEKMYLHHGE